MPNEPNRKKTARTEQAQPAPKPRAAATPPPEVDSIGKTLLLWGGICALAFVVRLFYLFQIQDVVFLRFPTVDGRAYDEWAQRIVAGDWRGQGVFYQAPLYPYFLAVTQLFVGHDFWRIRLVQILLGALSCGFLFLAGRRFFSRRAGIAAGVLLALYPPAIFFDALLQKAVLDLLWMTLLLWLLAEAREKLSGGRWLAVGVVLGLLILTRENALLLVPVLLGALGWRAIWSRSKDSTPPAPVTEALRDSFPVAKRFLLPGAFLAGVLVVLLPVALRNLFVGGEFALTTSQAGPNFYIGNNPQAYGVYVPLREGRGDPRYERQDALELAEKAVGRRLTPGEASRYWLGQAWNFISGQPGAWLALTGRKFFFALNSYEIPDAEDLYFYEKSSWLLRVFNTLWHFGILVPLAAAGIVLTWPQRRRLGLLYVVLVTLLLSIVLFYVFARYRYPLVPLLMLFAAAGLVEGVIAIRLKETRRVVAGAVALLAVAIFVNWPMPPLFSKQSQIAVSHTNAGEVLADHGLYLEALPQYQAAVQIEPRIMEAHLGLAKSLARLGRLNEAMPAYQAAVRLNPQAAQIEVEFGTALVETGQPQAAVAHLNRGLTLWPDNPEALLQLGEALLQLRQWGPAVDALRKSVELARDQMGNKAALSWALATCPDAALRDSAAALRLAEEIEQKAGDRDFKTLDRLAAAYAAAGQFEKAASLARQALQQLQKQAGAARITGLMRAEEIQARLELYQAGKPYLQAP